MITLTMTIDEVNAVLGALGQQPYGQVAPLIEKLAMQARQQVEEASIPEHNHVDETVDPTE